MNLNSRRKLYLIILFVTSSLIFLFNLGGRDLWDPDETRYAVVAMEMKESGNWRLPHLNGQLYAEKPPLFFWLVNLFTLCWGTYNEMANRLPSALAGLATILLIFFFGERLFNVRVGFFSAFVLATCFLFPQLSRWMMMDSLFTLLFFLALFYLWQGYAEENRPLRYYLLAGLFMGLGVLTKGPIAYLPIPIFLIFSFSQKNVGKFWNRNLLFGFLISLLVVLIWLVPACWMGGKEYTKEILLGQTIGRLAGKGRHFHPESIFFYFVRFPFGFLPWTFFIPAALIFGLRNGREKKILFLSIWFISIFLFFTFSKGKKDNYILPLYPAAALMIGALWDSGLNSQGKGKGLFSGLISLFFLFLIILIGSLIRLPEKLYPSLEPYHGLGLYIISYILGGLLLSSFFLIKKKRWLSFISLVATFTVFHLHISYILPLEFNGQKSMKAFSKRILKRMDPKDELKTGFFRTAGLLYYTRKSYIEEIRRGDRFSEILRSPNRIFLVIQSGDLDQIRKDLKMEMKPIEERRVWHWDLVLISNQER